MRDEILKYAALLAIALGCVVGAEAQKIKAVRDADSANVLSIRKARDLPDGDLAEKIEKDGRGKVLLVESADKIRQAFVFCIPSGSKEVAACVSRVFVTDLGADDTYEISGEELFIEANRLITELKWIDNQSLSYERWATPHHGHRYIVDVKRMKQTGAFILTN